MNQTVVLELTSDEFWLLSGAALYGLHCGGAGHAGLTVNLPAYTERIRRTLEPDSAARGVLVALARKLRAAADAAEQLPMEVFTR